MHTSHSPHSSSFFGAQPLGQSRFPLTARWLAVFGLFAILGTSSSVLAQEEAEAEEPVAAEAEVEAPEEMMAEPEPEPEEETPAEELPMAATTDEDIEDEAAAEPEAVEPEEFKPSFSIGVGLRSGLDLGLSGPTEGQLSLNDGLVDQVHIRPYMAGSLTPAVGYFVQFEVGTPNGLGSFNVLDAIGQIKFMDEVQLWVGQHIPANDRNNMNGPFFGNTWNFAIAVEEHPFDVGARDRGATLWGLIAGGRLKYHASIVDLQPGRDIGQARLAGRVTAHFLEPENFYYNSGTYFGSQDILTVGAVIQSQQGEDGTDSDLLGISVDAMFEKNLDAAGVITVEAGYWNFEGSGENYVVNQGTVDVGLGIAGPYPGQSFMGVLSWLTPEEVGPGKIQPNARFQYADWSTEERLVIDAGLAYVIDGFNHKYHINYRHAETTPAGGGATVKGDSIQLGFQYQMGM